MKELVDLISRKFSVVLVAFVKMVFPLLLLNGLLLFILSAQFFVHHLQASTSVTLILSEAVTQEQISFVNFKLSKHAAVEQYRLINPEAADTLLLQKTGEDFKKLLGFSPVPSSYTIKLNKTIKNYSVIESLLKEAKEYPGVTEVVFEESYGRFVFGNLPMAVKYLWLFAAGIVVLAVFMQKRVTERTVDALRQNRKKRADKGLKTHTGTSPVVLLLLLVSAAAGAASYCFIWLFGFLGYVTIVTEAVSLQMLFLYNTLSGVLLGVSGCGFLLFPDNSSK